MKKYGFQIEVITTGTIISGDGYKTHKEAIEKARSIIDNKSKELEKQGHTVAAFSVRYNETA